MFHLKTDIKQIGFLYTCRYDLYYNNKNKHVMHKCDLMHCYGSKQYFQIRRFIVLCERLLLDFILNVTERCTI